MPPSNFQNQNHRFFDVQILNCTFSCGRWLYVGLFLFSRLKNYTNNSLQFRSLLKLFLRAIGYTRCYSEKRKHSQTSNAKRCQLISDQDKTWKQNYQMQYSYGAARAKSYTCRVVQESRRTRDSLHRVKIIVLALLRGDDNTLKVVAYWYRMNIWCM